MPCGIKSGPKRAPARPTVKVIRCYGAWWIPDDPVHGARAALPTLSGVRRPRLLRTGSDEVQSSRDKEAALSSCRLDVFKCGRKRVNLRVKRKSRPPVKPMSPNTGAGSDDIVQSR